MSGKLFAVLVATLLTVNCAAQPEKISSPDDASERPLVVNWNNGKNTGPGYREAVNLALGKNARRVLVFFEEANGVNCAVEVRTIDTVCRTKDYGSIDPAVICRVASVAGSANGNDLDKIIWKGEEVNDVFKISFDSSNIPCEGRWPGRNFRRQHVCKLKTAAELGAEPGKAVYFKYNIISKGTTTSNPECDLDPHFIVRN